VKKQGETGTLIFELDPSICTISIFNNFYNFGKMLELHLKIMVILKYTAERFSTLSLEDERNIYGRYKMYLLIYVGIYCAYNYMYVQCLST